MYKFDLTPRTGDDCRLFGRLPAGLIAGLERQIQDNRPDQEIADFFREQILGPQMTEVAQVLHQRRGRDDTPFEHRLAALVDRDGVFFVGAERIEGCPPASAHAEAGALGAYISSGRFNGLVAGYVYDACTRRNDILALSELDVLDHHLDSVMGDIMWVGQHQRTSGLKTCLQSEAMSVIRRMRYDYTGVHVDESGRYVPLSQRGAHPAKVFYKFPTLHRLKTPAQGLVDALLEKAIEIFPNTTCINVRPASKGHAVWFVYKDEAVLVVNARDPDWHTRVRCAEMIGGSLAAALGWPHIDLVLLYSPDYEESNGSKRLLLPAPCSICRGIIHDIQNPLWKDLTLISSNGIETKIGKLSTTPERAYAMGEKNSNTGK